MSEFWNAAKQSSGGMLTDEMIREMFEAMRRQLHEPPSLCPHIHPNSYVRRLRNEDVAEVRCHWCGALCRL